MCHKTTCKNCGKPTWKGCGTHIEQALAGVPKNQRCTCTAEELDSAKRGGFFARIFGR
jgi:hypothetical protein